MTNTRLHRLVLSGAFAASLGAMATAQVPAKENGATPGTPAAAPAAPTAKPPAAPAPTTTAPAGTVPVSVAPADFVIGPDDVLSIVFWREKDLSGDVVVRPDGRISLPLLNEVQAAGLTPAQLRDKLAEAAAQYLEDPNATVVVKQINSRRVFITGQVGKPGPYSLTRPTTVVQLISMAGGLLEFADSKNIVVLRTIAGRQTGLRVNYRDVSRGKNMKQNIELQPGDTIIVP